MEKPKLETAPYPVLHLSPEEREDLPRSLLTLIAMPSSLLPLVSVPQLFLIGYLLRNNVSK